MRNHSPIILNCFSRGGSNILWNMFLTHPDVCSPIRETLQIFSIHLPKPKVEGVMAVLLSRQRKLFDQWFLSNRKPVPESAKKYIDQALFDWKLKTFSDLEMKFKYEYESYSLTEVKDSRLVIKNNNALTFLSEMFSEMYPDATFIALVRHPLALYESHLRRKTPVSRSVESFADYSLKMTDKMIQDAENFKNYHIVRFEDLINDPLASIQQLYQWADLDFEKLKKIRFKAKPHMQANGSHKTSLTSGQHYWFEFDQIHRILEPQVNAFQIGQIESDQKNQLLEILGERLQDFGYSD